MRPVTRGPSPQTNDFDDYRDAYEPLLARLGPYCSYCERRYPGDLAVEHIQPKDISLYPQLEGRWDNYLLACRNCNSTKGCKDVQPAWFYLPDRDNTLAAFDYQPDGTVLPARTGDAIAAATLELTGLDKPIRQAFDENGLLIASDRVSQRMEAWLKAQTAKRRLWTNPSQELEDSIVDWALSEGFFSVWMKVFADVAHMRRRFIDAFPRTAADCFDPTSTAPVSPRPKNALAGGGKI
jgi:hypothetical protein